MDLTQYRTLGRSGLAVSPLALGTMTFGTARWGLDAAGSRAVFDAYVEREPDADTMAAIRALARWSMIRSASDQMNSAGAFAAR